MCFRFRNFSFAKRSVCDHDCDEFIMSDDWVTLLSVIERVVDTTRSDGVVFCAFENFRLRQLFFKSSLDS